MNNTFSLQQISRTSNLDANLISRQYKLKLMSDFMRIKFENPKTRQADIANQLNLSPGTLERYRNQINMPSPYRIQANNTNKRTKKAKNTNFDENTPPNNDQKRPQLTSNDLKNLNRLQKQKTKIF